MAKSYSTVKDAVTFEKKKKKSRTLSFSLGIPLAYLCMCVLLLFTRWEILFFMTNLSYDQYITILLYLTTC